MVGPPHPALGSFSTAPGSKPSPLPAEPCCRVRLK
jgi:hypothetical protein